MYFAQIRFSQPLIEACILRRPDFFFKYMHFTITKYDSNGYLNVWARPTRINVDISNRKTILIYCATKARTFRYPPYTLTCQFNWRSLDWLCLLTHKFWKLLSRQYSHSTQLVEVESKVILSLLSHPDFAVEWT